MGSTSSPPRKTLPLIDNSVVLAGDSRLANQYAQSTPGTTVVANGRIATVTLNGHGLSRIGQEVSICASPDDALNGVFPVASILSPNQFTVQLDSIPTNPNNGPKTQVGLSNSWTNNGILTWLAFYARWTPSLLSNQAVGGATTAQILARATKVMAFPSRYVFFNGGINDTCTPPESVANLVAFATQLLAQGKILVYFADTTVSTGYTGLSINSTKRLLERNALMQAFCERTPNIIFMPIDGVTVNSADANGYGQGIMTGDGLHQSPTGAQGIGQLCAPFLPRMISPNIHLIRNPIDSCRVSAGSRNVIGNPLMLTTTAGKLQAGATGTVPYDWQAAATKAAAVASVTPRTVATHGDPLGNSFRLDVTQAAVSVGDTGLGMIASYVTPAGYFAAGDRLRAELELTASNLAGVANVYVQLVVTVGGIPYPVTWGAPGPGAYPQNPFKGPIRLPELYVPAGAITACQLTIAATFAPWVLNQAQGTASFEVARAGVLKM